MVDFLPTSCFFCQNTDVMAQVPTAILRHKITLRMASENHYLFSSYTVWVSKLLTV